jgi:hypothetical protein
VNSSIVSNGTVTFDVQRAYQNPAATFSVMDLNKMGGKKGGREKGSSAYSTTEHVALLSIISEVPDSFNASESYPQWEAVFKHMQVEFYLTRGGRTSTALHGHFVDLYSAFKQAVCLLSLLGSGKKTPSVYVQGDPLVEEYLDALDNLLQLGGKKFYPKKWWDCDVVEIIFPLHLAYSTLETGNKALRGWQRKVRNIRVSSRWIK